MLKKGWGGPNSYLTDPSMPRLNDHQSPGEF